MSLPLWLETGFDQTRATRLAAMLHSPPLPTSFTLVSNPPVRVTTGTLTGTLEQVGGPYVPGKGTPDIRVRGYVRVSQRGKAIRDVAVSSNGHFSATLPPGDYQVTGDEHRDRFHRAGCAVGKPVVVVAGRTSRTRVICPVP